MTSTAALLDALQIPYVTPAEAEALARIELKRMLALLESLAETDWQKRTARTEWKPYAPSWTRKISLAAASTAISDARKKRDPASAGGAMAVTWFVATSIHESWPAVSDVDAMAHRIVTKGEAVA